MTPETIDRKQIKSETRIGTLEGEPVVLFKTHGGFNLVMGKKDGKRTTLGTGPHPGLAKFIAKKNAPEMVMTEMSKSEIETLTKNEALVAKYEAVTRVFQNAFDQKG